MYNMKDVNSYDLESGSNSTLTQSLLPSTSDDEPSTNTTTPSTSLPSMDPMSWSPTELHHWLMTFSSSRYSDLAPLFQSVTGREICFMTSGQMVELVGNARGTALFNHVKEARKAAEKERRRRFEKLEKDALLSITSKSKSGSPPVGDFPPLLFIPSLKTCVTAAILGTIVGLLMTVWREETERATNTEIKTIIAYGSIPLIACAFTYFHIWLALYMTFFPLTYVGIGPRIPNTNVGFPLGWQGIIPFKAEKMARMAVRLMTEQLIDVKEEFSKLDVNRVAMEIDHVVLEKLQTIITNTFEKHQTDVWALLPDNVRDELVVKGGEAGPVVISKIMTEVKEDILSVFDIEEFVVNFMTSNKELLNKVFIQCGWDELCFIRDCGAILGGLFGFLQMLLWIPLHPSPPDEPMHPGWQSLSVFLGFGLVVGCATNYLALKIIFEPVEPIRIFGCYTLQGLFLKRQKEISAVYGKITATEVLSARNIIKEMLEGSNSPTLKALIRRHLTQGCEDFIGSAVRPIVRSVIGDAMDKMRDDAVDAIMSDLGSTMVHLEDYTQEALDMERTMSERMGALPARQFERLLHPVFEEDEWKLIVMGGVLGVLIGALQAYFIN